MTSNGKLTLLTLLKRLIQHSVFFEEIWNLKYCPTECKRLAYIALIWSTLEYGAIVWDPYKQQDIQSLENIQRQAARFIKHDYLSRYDGCVSEMLADLKLTPLQQRRLESRLVMLFKIVRGMVPAINADNVFTPRRNKRQIRSKNYQDCQPSNFVDRYNLNNSPCYKVPHSKTEQFRNYFCEDSHRLEQFKRRSHTCRDIQQLQNSCP